MEITSIKKFNTTIAIIKSEEILISDVQSALDLMATVNYDTGSSNIVIQKSAITEDFFQLSTRLAGEILQKFINYQVKIAIVGDYSHYTSKPLKDFIYECNRGKDIYFSTTIEEGVEKIANLFHPVKQKAAIFHQLEDDTVAFRVLHSRDAEEIHRFTSDEKVSRFIGWRLMSSLEETSSHIETMLRRESVGTHLYASVVLKSTGTVIGTVMIFDFDFDAQNAEIGYVFHKEYWGKGYGTRSVALLCKYAKDVLKLHKLHASVVAENITSAKILEKNGFDLEGRLKDHYFIEEKYLDSLVYGRILKGKDQE